MLMILAFGLQTTPRYCSEPTTCSGVLLGVKREDETEPRQEDEEKKRERERERQT